MQPSSQDFARMMENYHARPGALIRPSAEKTTRALVLYTAFILLAPLSVAILPPSHGAWWVLKILGGLATFGMVGGYIKTLEVKQYFLGKAYGGFLWLTLTYTIALLFRDTLFGLIMFGVSALILLALYPQALKRERELRKKEEALAHEKEGKEAG